MNKIKLVVYNGYALGYISPERPWHFSTLATSILRGAPFSMMCQPFMIKPDDDVRLASRKDFDDFRVLFDGFDNPQVYEFDPTESGQ